MASQNGRGVPSIVNSLIRQNTNQTLPDEDDGQGEGAGESVVATSSEPKPRANRKRKPVANEPAKGRKLSIPDSVFERLELTAIRRKTTISAVAADLLDRNLPRLRIESD